jgi:hypothetical protein
VQQIGQGIHGGVWGKKPGESIKTQRRRPEILAPWKRFPYP